MPQARADTVLQHMFDDEHQAPWRLAADRRAPKDARSAAEPAPRSANGVIDRHQADQQRRHRHQEKTEHEHALAPTRSPKMRHHEAAKRAGEIAGGEDPRSARGRAIRHAGRGRPGDDRGEKHEDDEIVELQRPPRQARRRRCARRARLKPPPSRPAALVAVFIESPGCLCLRRSVAPRRAAGQMPVRANGRGRRAPSHRPRRALRRIPVAVHRLALEDTIGGPRAGERDSCARRSGAARIRYRRRSCPDGRKTVLGIAEPAAPTDAGRGEAPDLVGHAHLVRQDGLEALGLGASAISRFVEHHLRARAFRVPAPARDEEALARRRVA